MKTSEIKEGDRFGLWRACWPAGQKQWPSGGIETFWLCVCDCGTFRPVSSSSLVGHTSTRCTHHPSVIIHGHSRRGNKSIEYQTWNNMIERCYHPSHVGYQYYGARGIKVCDRWRNSFQSFLEDMGPKPKGLSLDRINNDGNYEPSNCRWATQAEQLYNRRPYKVVTHCKRGHLLSPDNTYIDPTHHKRRCKICVRASQKISERKKHE